MSKKIKLIYKGRAHNPHPMLRWMTGNIPSHVMFAEKNEVLNAYIYLAHDSSTGVDKLSSLLHELGHIALIKSNPKRFFHNYARTRQNILREELSAWRYALRCVRKESRHFIIPKLLLCLRTYLRKPVTDLEILDLVGIGGDDGKELLERCGLLVPGLD